MNKKIIIAALCAAAFAVSACSGEKLGQKIVQGVGKAEGLDIEFGKDGSMSISDGENSAVINADGEGSLTVTGDDGATVMNIADNKMTITNEESGSVSIEAGGEWPDNGFTKLIPKPEMEIASSIVSEESFFVFFDEASAGQAKDYAEKIKAAGFDEDEEITDIEIEGVFIYSFSAKNADGYAVSVASSGNGAMLSVSAP